ncbi:MAG: sec-independent protein translocase protein TatA [Solirubrobacteraceae bacterium]|nr:sec-independent protein translocase protein TatA [Solirubrobacteraceae bacterium]
MIGDILQPTHLIFVLVIALLVLGPKRLPEVGRSLGKGLRDFKAAINGDDDDAPSQVSPPADNAPFVTPVTPVAPVAPVTAESTPPAVPKPAEHTG